MKKIRCLLVDDEPLAITLLQKHISQLDYLEVVAACGNALKAADVLKSTAVDLLFLDVQMPALSGLDFLKMLKNPPRVIITTAYRDYALEGYDLDIVDYLLKPITFERFFKSVERYLDRAALPGQADLPPAEPLMLKSGYRTVRVDPADIRYIESRKDYLKIHTGSGVISVKYKISAMEAELSQKNFLRIHRSFIVNLQYLTACTARDMEVGGTELPIGESYKAQVAAALKNRPAK